MGVDTVKLSYRLGEFSDGSRWGPCRPEGGWHFTGKHGTQGPVWWAEYRHEDGTVVRTKGVGTDAVALWEGSVPKYLGVVGAADPSLVRCVDSHLRELFGARGVPAPYVRRVDVTHDELDPDGRWLEAARGWNPHTRSRYRQAEHLNRTDGGRTVAQMNKSRMIRVYEKYPESGFLECYRDVTRVEYQMRGEWCVKMNVDRLYSDFEDSCDRALLPLVDDLRSRVGSV